MLRHRPTSTVAVRHALRNRRQREVSALHDKSVASNSFNSAAATQLRAAPDSIRSLLNMAQVMHAHSIGGDKDARRTQDLWAGSVMCITKKPCSLETRPLIFGFEIGS